MFTPAYRAYILGVLFVSYIFNFMDRTILAVVMPMLKSELKLMDWEIGLVTGGAFSVIYAVSGLPLAQLVDRTVRVRILSISIAVWSAATVLCGFAGSFSQLFLARIGVGLGEAGSSPCSASLISDLYGPRRRATAFGIYNAGLAFGTSAGLLIGAYAAHAYGWRLAFVIVGLPGLLVAAVMQLTVKEPPRGLSDGKVDTTHASVLEVARILFSRPVYRHYIIGASLSALVAVSTLIWAPSFLTRSYHMELRVVGAALALTAFLSGAIGNASGGFLADRLRGKSIRWRLLMPALAMLLSVPFAIVGFLGFNAWITVVFMGIAQTAPHTITGPGQATVQELVGQRMRGTAQALNFFTISLISGAIGPVLIGAASDALHAHFGEQSLRIALLGTTLVSIWSALHFYLASRHIEHDLSANNVRREVPDTPNLLYPAP